MRLDNDVKLDFKDVLIRPKRSTLASRSQVTLEKQYIFKHSKQTWKGVPIISANMDTTGTFEIAVVLASRQLLTTIHKHYSVDEWKAFMSKEGAAIADYIAVSTGIGESDIEKTAQILGNHPEIKMICVDVANGYSETFVMAVRTIRSKFPKHTIMAGNVVTGEMTEELILSGADVVKVGIGPGSVCTTRKQTGVGYPQLSAVMECADAAHGLGGQVISDGGCTCPGDVAKAFGAGADFVMLGGMLAGHDEAGGQLVESGGKKFKLFYGMSSGTAMGKYAGGVAEYRSSEGKTVKVPYRGPIDETIKDVLGGLRSACTYVGAATLKEISKRTTFIRVTQQLNSVFDPSTIPDIPKSKKLKLDTSQRQGAEADGGDVPGANGDGVRSGIVSPTSIPTAWLPSPS
uniref:GMP reductase n=1 Tax=Chromera velia CCMP2878 TaxID=1169474 RepID=A0A0G4HAN6_9ALVE|mmetsp:Transcript_27532/g.54002  ORF Transcript_27532/g.54002 Transcript_27532/m.54002 type:complete len:403 (+) Transcript_27532:192-1400(+)|eukprot:Cvel_25765.t1-p1 / transcript=Cvel_25765.t1 / gene=Cvel_25765 / organism=Chromera_velia_CCMP2878 / gene_product=GMP reductase 2, putative / transcript_product=GMP reductase 2, putative / location=Cvel_scaffold2968:1821-6539(+) / protein_length=402 / sequence_SO=supercontig / SO=protein_coding / is_pseudo=false